MLTFDIESNGLLDAMTQIHCIAIHDDATGINRLYEPHEIAEAVLRLADYEGPICGHNVIAYDIPAIQKLYPWFNPGKVLDTLVMSRLVFSALGLEDDSLIKNAEFPRNLRGSHSLEAWGHRLGQHKADYSYGWETYNETMGLYCAQDVLVCHTLFKHLMAQKPTQMSLDIEHKTQHIVQRQVRRGVYFDTSAAQALLLEMTTRKKELEDELKAMFGSIYVALEEFTPSADNARLGYTGGCPFTRVELQEFNPNSRQQIAMRLAKKYGWKPDPKELTPSGAAKIDEDVLSRLDYPEAQLLMKFLLVNKRISQLSEGDSGWLRLVKANRVHGGVNTGGTVTGRMTHSAPNLAQVPGVKKDKTTGAILMGEAGGWGYECRALFQATPGFKLVGCDADALELRNLAHYMARFDGGEYARTVDAGKKEDGTDAHTLTKIAAALPSRDDAKRIIYALMYGSGDQALGGGNKREGKRIRDCLMKRFPALEQLTSLVKQVALDKGFLVGLDGRRIPVAEDYTALNYLLQSAGAILMKKALVILDSRLQTEGLKPGVDYEFVLNVHDEWQLEVLALGTLPERVAKMASEAITEAGQVFKFKCPHKGSWSIGQTWAETH